MEIQQGRGPIKPPEIKIETDVAQSINEENSDQSVNSKAFVPVRTTPRRSIDSIASLGSVTTTTTATGNHRFMFSMDSKSGSMNYSPLGNNSIFEIIMNTRYKQWLKPPTNLDITPVALSKNDIAEDWNETVAEYVSNIKDDAETFVNRSNLKNINRLEEMKLYQNENNEKDSKSYKLNNTEELEIINEENDVINQIPEFYFEKSFNLDNERTFRKVLEGIDLKLHELNKVETETDDHAQQSEKKQRSKNIRDAAYVELKEKLNDYLDLVESALVGELSKSSSQFFYALSEVDNIQKKSSDTISELEKLSLNLKNINDEKITKRITNLKRIFKKKNIEILEQGLLQVKLVIDKVQECKLYYKKDDYDMSLDMMNSIDYLIRGDDVNDPQVNKWTEKWPYKLVNLKSVPALLETRELLTNMKIEIGGKVAIQLTDLLLGDIREHYENINTTVILNRLQSNYEAKKSYLEFEPQFQDSIRNMIIKLNRCEELTSAFSLYQDKCMVECKNIIKKYLPSTHMNPDSAAVSTAPSTTSLASTQNDASNDANTSLSEIKHPPSANVPKLSTLIREQTPLEFQNMLIEIFTRCSEALRRLFQHQKLLLDIALKELNSLDEGGNSENKKNMITQLDIRTGINEIIGIIQSRMGKVIAVRKEITSSLRYDYFLTQYTVIVLFIQECEALSGEFLTKYLSDILASQIKHCISNRDTRNVRTIQKKIELENWQPFIVNPSFQRDVNEIVSSVDIDPLMWTNIVDLASDTIIDVPEGDKPDKGSTDKPSDYSESHAGNRKSVVVGDNTFVASDSLLTAIGLIRELLILSTNLPSLYLSYFEKLCFSLLKYFNTYTMGTVSQPGRPMKSSGKNLAIMAETLDCLAEFVSIVQRFYQRVSNSSRDFVPYDPSNYATLLKQYQASTERIYAANAPPPPT